MGIASFQQLICMLLMWFMLFSCACSCVNTWRTNYTWTNKKNIFFGFPQETTLMRAVGVSNSWRLQAHRAQTSVICYRWLSPTSLEGESRYSAVGKHVEQLSIFNPIHLALFVPIGRPEFCDGWIPSKTHAGPYRLQTQKEAVTGPL